MAIKAVIFDCFGVLYPDTYWTMVRKYARDLPERRPLFHDLVKRVDLGLLDREDFWDEVARLLDVSRSALDADIENMGGIDVELLDYIGDLRSRGFKIGMISNVGHGFIERVFGDRKPTDYFDDMVLSSVAGFIKPDPRIYRLAAKNLGVETTDCFFVDDSSRNVEGAVAVGMQAMAYADFDEMKDSLEMILAPKE